MIYIFDLKITKIPLIIFMITYFLTLCSSQPTGQQLQVENILSKLRERNVKDDQSARIKRSLFSFFTNENSDYDEVRNYKTCESASANSQCNLLCTKANRMNIGVCKVDDSNNVRCICRDMTGEGTEALLEIYFLSVLMNIAELMFNKIQ
ncbi:uncharacterized protein LOC142330525 [Lycorma delicatula]|uniref:uncharacterized protein LOC142330525 n=1 Tax=Lycorma delicatula TaxID=130591 RepID=UPI003F5129B6